MLHTQLFVHKAKAGALCHKLAGPAIRQDHKVQLVRFTAQGERCHLFQIPRDPPGHH